MRDAGRTDAQYVGGPLVHGVDVTEVERLGAGDRELLPRAAAIRGPDDGAICPLAQTTRSFTALTPRNRAVTPLV